MKLLLVTTVFPTPLQPEKGAFNHEMVKGFGPSHDIRVVAPIAWPVVWRAWRQGRARDTARRVDNLAVRYPVYFYTPSALRSWYGGFFSWSIRRAVKETLRDFSPDVVAGYWAHPDGYAALAIARQLGVPSVIMVGGSDVLLLGQQARRGRLIRQVLHEADAVVTVSQDLRRAVLGWSLPDEKVHVVRRGVDLARFAPGSRDEARRRLSIDRPGRILLWVGHMVAVKGLDTLLEACAIAAPRVPFDLYLVGDGPLRPELERRCSALSIADRVRFVGAVSHASLPDWYRAADWTILSSRSEGVPNVLLESSACGTPFIAPRVGGIPEIADPLVDRLVAAADPAALADAICRSVTTTSHLKRRVLPASIEDASHHLLAVLTSTIARTQRDEATHVSSAHSAEARP